VRSADQSASVVIPAGTDVVSLRLEGDPGTAAPGQRTILIRTVTGDEIWRGQAIEEADRSAGTAARVDVPAPRLVTDDYVIELDIANREGVARELYRYFLRVRDR